MKGTLTLRLLLALWMTVVGTCVLQAQQRTYSGVVTGSDCTAVAGASVTVQGTTVGTATDLDGRYSINAQVGSTLNFSFLGMKSVSVTVGNTQTINVTLEDDAQSLEDVVVIAFGTAKKKDLTGSLSSIDSEIIEGQLYDIPFREILAER